MQQETSNKKKLEELNSLAEEVNSQVEAEQENGVFVNYKDCRPEAYAKKKMAAKAKQDKGLNPG